MCCIAGLQTAKEKKQNKLCRTYAEGASINKLCELYLTLTGKAYAVGAPG